MGYQQLPLFICIKRDKIVTDHIIKKVGLPCFVKPNRSGSSFGISKVYKEANLKIAIEKAYIEDEEILIESFLEGTEVSVGVIEYQGEAHRFANYRDCLGK